MSRFTQFVYRDCSRYSADEKTAVYDQIRKGPKTVSEIAEATGFTDASYFAKSFKATFGITPKEYRAQFSEDFI